MFISRLQRKGAAGLRCWLSGLACVLAVVAGPARADTQANGRSDQVVRQIEAAYLYKFASYVEWPPEAFSGPDSSFTIGLAGSDALADELEASLAERTMNGRKVVVRRLRRGDAATDVQMLVVGTQDARWARELYAAIKDRPVLTIAEPGAESGAGSMISFAVVDDRLRFEVALKPIKPSRLKVSALMLSAAYKVEKGTP
ncbi:MAG: YfiR family protein [Massilia sp.]